MATIVLRNTKGSALTFTEGDANFTNLNNDKLENISADTNPALGGNLDCGSFQVSDLNLKDYKEVIYSLGTTDAPTLDPSNGNVQSVTIGSALTMPAFTSASAGQSITLIVNGSGTASGTGAYIFASGSKVLTTKSIVSILYDGTTYWTSIATNFTA